MELKRDQLFRDPEQFRVILEIDGTSFGIILTAYNKSSIIALLQIMMIANHERIAGYVVRREGSGELLASVQARQYIEQMTQASRLKDPPKSTGDAQLPLWDLVKVRQNETMSDERAKDFVLEIVIDGIVENVPVTAPNADSIIALLTAATVKYIPRIAGWNLYDASGELLASVPAMDFLNILGEMTLLGKQPANVKSAGWRAMPVVSPTTEEFQMAIEKAKKEGKIPK